MTQTQKLTIEELFAVAEICVVAFEGCKFFEQPENRTFQTVPAQAQPKIAVVWVELKSSLQNQCWSDRKLQTLEAGGPIQPVLCSVWVARASSLKSMAGTNVIPLGGL